MTSTDGLAVKGIIFDLDGTLYRMKWFMKPLLTISLFPRSLLLPRYMAARKDFSGRDLRSGEALLSGMATELARRTRHATPEGMRSWIMHQFYPSFEALIPLMRNSRPGLGDLLTTLRKKNIKLAVLSDFARIHERLNGLRISSAVFDRCVSAETEGCLKPCPRPYRDFVRCWNIEAATILVIGDRSDTDGEAAKATGMCFIQISDTHASRRGEGQSWPQLRRFLSDLPPVVSEKLY